MVDTSLLEKEGAISIEDLMKHFQTNDFSAMVSLYESEKASSEQNQLYRRAKKHFRTAWNAQMKMLTGKDSLANFSEFAPVRCLQEREEDLISGVVMELLADEAHSEAIMDQTLEQFREPLLSEIETYAATIGKTTDSLSEEEFAAAVNQFVDLFLGKMMNLLQQTQQVPELMRFMHDTPAHEDFNNSIKENYDKIDFMRAWYHLRTKIGAMLSLSDFPEAELADSDEAIASSMTKSERERAEEDAEYDRLLQAFCKTLNDIDSQIVYMCDEDLTQKEMAERLGYANHSAVSKRLKKIYKKYCAFLDAQPKDETE